MYVDDEQNLIVDLNVDDEQNLIVDLNVDDEQMKALLVRKHTMCMLVQSYCTALYIKAIAILFGQFARTSNIANVRHFFGNTNNRMMKAFNIFILELNSNLRNVSLGQIKQETLNIRH